jgi:hypothetical protein
MTTVPTDLSAALETLRKVLAGRPDAQDIVACLRCDGRAEVDFVNGQRQYIGPLRRFVEAGGWHEIDPSKETA